MLEITYLIYIESQDVDTLNALDIDCSTYEGSDDTEYQVEVTSKSIELLRPLMTDSDRGTIKHKNVTLIRFHT